jgi:hypothetical protein
VSETCETCRFFTGAKGIYKIGRCRRFPPSRPWTRGRIDESTWYQPTVSPNDWCGEYVVGDTEKDA